MSRQITVMHPDGAIEGIREASGLAVFKGIPFARAQRWQRAELQSLPKGTLRALAYGAAPIQPPPDPFFAQRSGEPRSVPMSEDCLNLNIWTGDAQRPQKPVLFWIYGGSYIQGYNYKRGYLPDALLKEHPDLLVVAPNYRVGVLGSLNLAELQPGEPYRYSNNLALLDLVTALQWVRKYIHLFGGDPDCITLYGHSAGSNAITHLMTMKEAQGLFQRAICQSSFMADQGTVALDTSREIGCKFLQLTGASTLQEALQLPVDAILEAQKKLFGFRYGGRASKMFSPVADGVVLKENAFIQYVRGNFHGRQLMIGCSEGEYDQMFLHKSPEETRAFVLQRNEDKRLTPQQLEAFAALHPEMSEKEACMSVHNELGLILGGELIARACSQHIPVYSFVFRLRDPQEHCRALHGAPCDYVFGTRIPENAPPGLMGQMMAAWEAFIRTGDPNHPGIPPWPAYQPDGPVMAIDSAWQAVPAYWQADFHLWKHCFRETKML